MLGERNVCFRSLKMYQNSPTAMLNSNIFPETISRTPVLGERKICFCSPKMHHNSPTAMQNSKIFRGTISRTFVLGRGGKFFSFSENVPKLSYSEAEFKKIPGDNIFQTPVLGERKVCFCSPKMYQNSPIAMQNSKIFPVTIHWTPVLGERKVGFISPKIFQNAPTAMQNSKKFQNSRIPVFGKRGESCLLLKLCLATPLVQREENVGRGIAGKLNDSSTCRRSLGNSDVRLGKTCRAFARHTRLYIRYFRFVHA